MQSIQIILLRIESKFFSDKLRLIDKTKIKNILNNNSV